MSEKEKTQLEKTSRAITDALPGMSEFDRGYLLGRAEEMAAGKRETNANFEKQAERTE